MKEKPTINVFWFKRDLRLQDNDALFSAVKDTEVPLLLVYIYEPSLLLDEHYSHRHWRFVQESLDDLNVHLKPFQTEILIVRSEVIGFFDLLQSHYEIKTVFSTEETGLKITYDRDIAFKNFCELHGIFWKEFQNNGVLRGIKNRDTWRNKWYAYMSKEIQPINFQDVKFLSVEHISAAIEKWQYEIDHTETHEFQKGGRTEGKLWEDSFFDERIAYYSEYISKPEMARYGCSRLSPYHAWGCISIREVYQRNIELKKSSPFKKQLSAHRSRLRWQSHFIQKFEQEPRIEFEAFNKGYLELDQPFNEDYGIAWTSARTGYPLVDASLRAVAETGYLNFRMRTMTTSFLHHHLFQHFRVGSKWLARQFLDFEPGIHYAQLQMQAGFTATNTIRIYNPTKNAHDHDPEAIFIKKWLPELKNLPAALAIEPWLVTPAEEQMYNFKLGRDYPERIVDIKETRAVALKALYGQRKTDLTKTEKQRILDTHTLKRNYKNG